MDAFIYIVECADGTLYTGWTFDVEKRVTAHNRKLGAKYTKARTPVRLVYKEGFPNKQLAQQREYAVKQLSRQEKLDLIHRATAINQDKEKASRSIRA